MARKRKAEVGTLNDELKKLEAELNVFLEDNENRRKATFTLCDDLAPVSEEIRKLESKKGSKVPAALSEAIRKVEADAASLKDLFTSKSKPARKPKPKPKQKAY